MKTKHKDSKYVAWLSTEAMHKASRKWLSELEFAKDEQLFFDDLIKSYTLQLIDSKHFNKSKNIVSQIVEIQVETNNLIDGIKKHDRELKIMVDGINQIDLENDYKDKHGKLIITMSEFLEKYKTLKSQLFKLVTSVIKEGKQKRLLQ
jgi:hypothetical protein